VVMQQLVVKNHIYSKSFDCFRRKVLTHP